MSAGAPLRDGLSSSTEPLRVSSADAASILSAWQAGSFVAQTVGGERIIAGWIASDFALDFRVYEDDDDLYGAWHLTHVATGYSVCHFKDADWERAASLVDDLRQIADWSFVDRAGAADAAFAFTEFRDNNQPIVRRGAALLSCTAISPEASAMSARSAETGTGSVRQDASAVGDSRDAQPTPEQPQ